jgi:acyl-CoA thioester hydrolase
MSDVQIPAESASSQSWDAEIRLRVRYCECDPMGVVHHASYIPWLEEARTELLRNQGRTYAALESQGVLLVIVKLDVAYRRSARYDDVVVIRCRIKQGSRVKIEHEYEIVIESQSEHGPPAEQRVGATCVVARTVLACVNREGKVQELPAELLGG